MYLQQVSACRPLVKQSECEPHNLILQLQKTREEKEMEVMEKNKLKKKVELLDCFRWGK